jgi:hypothetical protein
VIVATTLRQLPLRLYTQQPQPRQPAGDPGEGAIN